MIKSVETYNGFDNDIVHIKISNNFVDLIFMMQNENWKDFFSSIIERNKKSKVFLISQNLKEVTLSY